MKKIFILFIILIILLLSPSLPIMAEEASSSSLTDKIKERLEKTAEQGLQTIKDQLTAKALSPRKKAYIGKIKSIDQNNLILSYKNQDFKVTLNDFTQFSKTSRSKLAIDDFIIAMGFVYPDQKSLSAHKITYVKSISSSNHRQLLSGKIKEIDGNKITLSGKKLTFTTKTNLVIKGIDNPSLDDVQLEDNLFVIVSLDNNGDITAVKQALVLPGKNNTASLEPTNASQSAQATPSANKAQ